MKNLFEILFLLLFCISLKAQSYSQQFLFQDNRTNSIFAGNVSSSANVNANSIVLDLSEIYSDGSSWSLSTGNTLQFSGNPSIVKISVNIAFTSASARTNPKITIKEVSGSVRVIGAASHSYARNANGHNETSSNITIIDPSPPANPIYIIESSREANSGNVTIQTPSTFWAEAIF